MNMKAGVLFAICALVSTAAYAQQLTWTDRGFVNVNLGAQTGSHDLATTGTFEQYEELGTLSTAQSVGGGGLFDIGAGYKVWRNLAVGVSYSRSKSDADVAIAATVPDPIVYDQPRAITASASGLDHSESAIHLQGTWVMPFTDTVDFAFSFGPTIFMVSQELPAAIEVTEPGPAVRNTTFTTEDKTTLGINLGVDVNYMFTPQYGAGLLARYTWGSVNLDSTSDSLSIGGFQIGVGFRYRF